MHAKVHAAGAPAPVSKPRLSFWAIWNMSFGFLGIHHVDVVRAERLTKGAELREASIAAARGEVPAAVAHALMA